jgi:hypothetical protein
MQLPACKLNATQLTGRAVEIDRWLVTSRIACDIPLAFIFCLLGAFMRSIFSRLPKALAFAFLANATIIPAAVSQAPDRDTPPGLTEMLAHLDRARGATLQVLNTVDVARFDIGALQAKLGNDPGVLFAFVRDNISYDPYVGSLRGAQGALLSRSGNALDRSLLLAALLSKAGHDTEVVSGMLDASSAGRLVSQAGATLPLPSAGSGASPVDLARAFGLPQQQVADISSDITRRAEAADTSLLEIAQAQSAALQRQLAIASTPTVNLEQQLAAAAEHHWVRYRDVSGAIRDLDSSFRDAAPGQSFAAVAAQFRPDAIPEELRHRLRIVVTLRVGERESSGPEKVVDTVLIDRRLDTSDRQGQLIRIENLPIPSLEQALQGGAAFDKALDGVTRYVTVLTIGDKAEGSKFFDLRGTLTDSAEGVAGGFGGLGGGLDRLNRARRIIGQWLDITVTSPGSRGQAPVERHVRRDILAPDTVTSWSADGPVGGTRAPATHGQDQIRRGLLYQVELTPMTGMLDPDYVSLVGAEVLHGAIGFAENVAKRAYGRPVQGSTGDLLLKRPLAGLAFADYVGTHAARVIARYPGLRIAIDRPGIIAYERRLGADAGAGFRQGYDIMIPGFRVVARPTSVPDASIMAEATALLGALMTRSEWALLDRQMRTLLMDQGALPLIENVSELTRAAQAQGIEMKRLEQNAGGLAAIAGLAVDDSVKAELAVALGAGRVLVAPASRVALNGKQLYGWWQYDPSTSALIGIMQGGRGQAQTEDAWLIWYTTKYLSAANSGIFGLATGLLCMIGLGQPDHLDQVSKRRKGACLVVAVSAAAGGYGYFGAGSAAISGMSLAIGVIAQFISMIPD